MYLYECPQWIQDIDIVSAELPELNILEGKTILITGAAGLICSSIVDILFRYNDTHPVPIHIVAAGRRITEMETRFGQMIHRPDFTFIKYDASKTDNIIPVKCDYIIHGASNATPAMIVKEPVETMMSNFIGLKFLLDYAKCSSTETLLYISSSEIYGTKTDAKPFYENQYGFIDLLNPRNSYSTGKRAAETLCAAYASEYGVKSVIVRPGHIYGPTASPNDNRVSSAWAYSAARGENIIMKSDGSQLRSYCYCLDCASAILKVLLFGKAVSAYNISNPNSIISIKEMALCYAEAGSVQLLFTTASSMDRAAFNPMTNSSLDSTNLMDLGWRGCFSAKTGLKHTVSILKTLLDDRTTEKKQYRGVK